MNSLKILCFSLLMIPPAALWASPASDYKDAGQALLRAGQYAKAVDYFKNAVQADPQDAEAYQDLGDAYSKLGDTSNARAAYEKSLQIDPENPTARAALNGLGPSPAAQDRTNFNTSSQDHPSTGSSPAPATGTRKFDEDNTVTQQAEPWHKNPGAVSAYATGDGGLPYMDRAKIWLKVDGGYNYSAQPDLLNSATVETQLISTYGWTGTSMADRNGYNVGGELGFLINPNVGFALGLRYLRSNDYHLNQNLQNGPATVTGGGGVTYDSDFEDETFSPSAGVLSGDFYFFLPDPGGRFFVSAGVGLYRGTVHVEDNYSYVISNDDPGFFDNFSGDLYADGVGFQASVGRDFALGPRWSLSVYGRGRYARLTNFRGTVYTPDGYQADDGLALYPNGEVFSTDVSNIGNNGVNYASVDFTGFDVGLALTFYAY
jgi:hypothetical protein